VILLTPMQWSGDAQLPANRNILCTVNKPVRQSQLFDALNTVVCSKSADGVDAAIANLRPISEPMIATFSGHVLLVEDNPVNQEVATHYLHSFGCTLDLADSCAAALTASNDKKYDLIFMDCQMPIMDGFTTTDHIRKRERLSGQERTPIVALTAGAFIGDRERRLAAGMDDYISKPFAPSDLQNALDKWLVSQPADQSAMCPSDKTNYDDREIDDASDKRPSHEHLDHRTLEGLRSRSAGLLPRLIKLYQGHAPSLLDKIHNAQTVGDCTALKSAAHALKSSSANVAAMHMAELCQLLEVKSQTNDIAAAREICEEIVTEFDQVSQALDNEITTSAELV
jgi:CheY-like chemotaxis protein/HPt (histidine-containing phosphotransfer) domain-containing protein